MMDGDTTTEDVINLDNINNGSISGSDTTPETPPQKSFIIKKGGDIRELGKFYSSRIALSTERANMLEKTYIADYDKMKIAAISSDEPRKNNRGGIAKRNYMPFNDYIKFVRGVELDSSLFRELAVVYHRYKGRQMQALHRVRKLDSSNNPPPLPTTASPAVTVPAIVPVATAAPPTIRFTTVIGRLQELEAELEAKKNIIDTLEKKLEIMNTMLQMCVAKANE